jgi:hypothetical protein
MSILSEATVVNLHERRGSVTPLVDFQVRKDEAYFSIDYIERFSLEAKIAVDFYANRANYLGALENAKMLLAQHVYKDVLYKLLDIKAAVFGHDYNSVIKLTEELEQELRDSLKR